MGQDTSKQKQAPDMNQVIFQMKMSSKRFLRESKRSQKEKDKNLKSAEACLKKGDEEGAKLYAVNAQNNINDYRKYLTMSSRLDAIAGRIKTNYNSADIIKHLTNNVTPVLMKEADTMDLADLCRNFETFQEAFDKMTVNANIMNTNFDKMTAEGNTIENADNLFNQLKNKVQYDMARDNGMPVELNVTQSQKSGNKQEDRALDDYIEDLKKM